MSGIYGKYDGGKNCIEVMRQNRELIDLIKKEDPYFDECKTFHLMLWWFLHVPAYRRELVKAEAEMEREKKEVKE